MKTNFIKSLAKTVSLSCSRAKMSINANSSEILVITGAVGVIVGTVLACKATLKADMIIETAGEQIEKIKKCVENPDIAESCGETYSKEDALKDELKVCADMGFRLLRVYAPALIVEITSLAMIFKGHDILKKRFSSLVAAYTALDQGYSEYRKRVKEAFGEDADRRIRQGYEVKEVDTAFKDEEGREMTRKTETEVRTRRPLSQYARLFDENNSSEWDKHPGYNLAFLKAKQRYANDLLRSRYDFETGKPGWLFLNEVYNMLGFSWSGEGQEIGWLYDPRNPNLHNFVDFGIYDTGNRNDVEAFIYGDEKEVWLDFNVDGLILYTLPRFAKKAAK